MNGKKYTWHKIAETVGELHPGSNNMTVVTAGGKKITLISHEGSWHACAHSCPHAGGKLAEGFIDAQGNIVCPLHRYRFSIANGRNTSGEGYFLKTYPVETRADGIYVGMEERGLFNLF